MTLAGGGDRMSSDGVRPAPSEGRPCQVRLRNGERVTVRAVTPADEPALADFLASLCLEARRMRFFSGGVDVATMARYAAAGGPERAGLLALDQSASVVGHAFYVELAPGRAEVAVEVADRLHGHGLGTILIERLAQLAERRGITRFSAEVLPDNRAMLDVFRDG